MTGVPITTAYALEGNLPVGGGGQCRLAPFSLSRCAIRRFNRDERQPAVFCWHSWDFDQAQPRVSGVGLKMRIRHYVNRQRTEARLARLLHDFRWRGMDQKSQLAATSPVPLRASFELAAA